MIQNKETETNLFLCHFLYVNMRIIFYFVCIESMQSNNLAMISLS